MPEYGLMVVVGEGRDAVLKHARGQRNHFLMIAAAVLLGLGGGYGLWVTSDKR